ncbi:right-handed parallel beta-helix repeat-containing protein, partial [Verrucomicrobium spinosum]|uniref:right-handed parallel beta-helix repeat-containing protein n=1 Tax=Verrucomicrobium spinosum TaxID=2736 RepID=UPI00210EFFFB
TWTDPGTQVATTLADMNMQGLDLDSDGISNADEATEETNPYSIDTDLDGMTDSEEIVAGCNPLVDDAHADYDGDRYPNIFEVKNSSDPFAVGSIPTPHYVVDPNGGGTHTSLYEPSYSAYNYEIILVQPGIYTGWENTSLSFYGDVLLISAGGAASTIIDGEGTNAGISLSGNVVVEGLTIKNTANYYGGSIYASGGRPSLINCILLNNSFGGDTGGAIYVYGADLMVVHCTAIGNAPNGIHADNSAVTVHNSIFWNRPGFETLLENGATLEVSNSIFRGAMPELATCRRIPR